MNRLVVLLLFSVPVYTQASSCGFKSYNSYHGYSTYQNGSYYWQGGYYNGDSHYSAGYYAPGYYDYNHYTQPYFIKYKAVIPLIEIPTYGIYVKDSPPDRMTAPVTPTTASASSVDGKLDKILALTEKTSKDVDNLRVRVEVLEGKRSPEPPARAPVDVNPDQVAIDILHKNCYACHESKAVAVHKSRVVLFVKGDAGDEMATLKDSKVEPLSPAVLKKVRDVVADKSMPPEKDKDGKAVAVMSDDERKKVLAFLAKYVK